MLYNPSTFSELSSNVAREQATTWAATLASLRSKGRRRATSGQLRKGVQARVALAEVLAVIADCDASQQVIPGLSWLICP